MSEPDAELKALVAAEHGLNRDASSFLVGETVAELETSAAVAEQVAAGKVRSGWAVLRKRLEAATQARSDIQVSVDERQAKVAATEAWIR